MTDHVPDPPLLFRRLEEEPLRALFTPDDCKMIKLAYILAKAGHRHQSRKEGGRYFDHPLESVKILLFELEVIDAVTAAAVLLHDCGEDARDITIDLIEYALGSEVARLVLHVTKLPDLPKTNYLPRLIALGDPRALFVKAVDRLSNLRSLRNTDRAFIVKQVTETRTEFISLLYRLIDVAPPQHHSAAQKVKDLILAELASLDEFLLKTAV